MPYEIPREKNLGSENFGEMMKCSQNGMLSNIAKSNQWIGGQGQRYVGWGTHGEQVVNTSRIDKNSLGMRMRPSVELATSAR